MKTLDEMKTAIIEALKSKKVSANKVNPASKGKYAGYLAKGVKGVNEKQIARMYEKLIELGIVAGDNGQDSSPLPILLQSRGNKEEAKQMATEIEELKQRVSRLEDENRELRNDRGNKENNKVMEAPGQLKPGDIVEYSGGKFKIRLEKSVIKLQTKAGVKVLVYRKYFAKLKCKGKLHRVYIGETATEALALEKIKAYTERQIARGGLSDKK